MIDVGQTVGNYNITATLGSGGMGTVFLAEHPVIGSKVALKAIHPQFARSAEVFGRFVNEAKAVNQIGHDHIIDITDFGKTPSGDHYFMMEYLQGDTLAAAIARDGRFPPERALNIAAQVADALDAAHGHGIIHRDLKPENIFLMVHDGISDFVKVLDFGLAKLTNPDEVATFESRVGSVMGTPYYMSPEQCEGRPNIDHRADVYALGVMLFEMVTGMIPFGGTGYGEILVKHVTVPAPAASSIVAGLPRSLDSILLRALAKDPAHRFQTMAEFREAVLDSERYGSLDPVPSRLYEELTGRVDAARPMARTELAILQPTPGSERDSLAVAAEGQSTFRDSVGEVWVRGNTLNLIPKTHRMRALLILCAFGAALGAGVKYRHQTTRFLDASSAAVTAATRNPVQVRVNLSSEPAGATVSRADGTLVGLTPLSTDVPSEDLPLEYIIRKEGYLPKTASILPNGPATLLEVLQRDEPAPPPVDSPAVAPPIVVPPVVAVPPVAEPPATNDLDPQTAPRAKKSAAKRSGHPRAKVSAGAPTSPIEPEPDESMAPTTPTVPIAPTTPTTPTAP
jgi:eukaryotic-like serine/threonine-protein kinase